MESGSLSAIRVVLLLGPGKLVRSGRGADAVGDARHVGHLAHSVHTDDVGAEQNAGGDGCSRAPLPLGRLTRA